MNENQSLITDFRREIIFLSSGKAKAFADKVRQQLSDRIQNDPWLRNEYECLTWDNRRLFRKSHTTFDSLLKYAQWLRLSGGYAICVLYPDDVLYKDGDENSHSYYVPRDNVIFELGLFYGALGQDNTFYLLCHSAYGKTVHKPTDLDGVTEFQYQWDDNKNAPEKDSERKLAVELLDTISDLIEKNKFQDITKESVAAETTAMNIHQFQTEMLNEFLEEKDLEAKSREREIESVESVKPVKNTNEGKKNYFPKPLTHGIDPK